VNDVYRDNPILCTILEEASIVIAQLAKNSQIS